MRYVVMRIAVWRDQGVKGFGVSRARCHRGSGARKSDRGTDGGVQTVVFYTFRESPEMSFSEDECTS